MLRILWMSCVTVALAMGTSAVAQPVGGAMLAASVTSVASVASLAAGDDRGGRIHRVQARQRDRPDHNAARDAVRSGQARPLGDIIRAVRHYCPGRFLDAALREQRGRLIYSVRMLSAGGRRTTIEVDARSGAILGGRC